MSWKRDGFVVLSMAALFGVLLPMSGLIAALWVAGSVLPSAAGTAITITALVLHLTFYVLLFFDFAQSVLLRALRATSTWAFILTGILSGWLFLFEIFVDASLGDEVLRAKSAAAVL